MSQGAFNVRFQILKWLITSQPASRISASQTPSPMQSFAYKKRTNQDETGKVSPSPPPKRHHACDAAAPPTSPALPPAPLEKAPAPTIRGGLAELLGDKPLRLIIVGHNPSETAWQKGHYYANPSNWLWRILRETGIAPREAIQNADDDYKMPSIAGVGFTDVGSGHPGTDSSKFTSTHFVEWRQPFFDRLAQHGQRASLSIGCTCGACGAPVVVAFSGKRQFAELFDKVPGGGGKKNPSAQQQPSASEATDTRARTQRSRPLHIPLGRQSVLPTGWPFPLDSTEVWVMTSTSGAAPMTREQRYAPWSQLAERLQSEEWPRTLLPRCQKVIELEPNDAD